MPRCPDSRIVAAALGLPTSFTDAVTSAEPLLPAYSGVTVWAFHPLRVVTGNTSVAGAEYSTIRSRVMLADIARKLDHAERLSLEDGVALFRAMYAIEVAAHESL